MVIRALNVGNLGKDAKLLRYLPKDKQTRILMMKNDVAAKTMLYAHILLLELMESFYGYKWSELIFLQNMHGKPFLKNIPVHFNISHKNELVICALDENNIGIDIEQVRESKIDISPKVLSEKEMKTYKTLSETEKRYYLCKAWTLKESYVKYLGVGLKYPVNEISFELDADGKISSDCDENLFFEQFFLDTGYSISICTEHEIAENSVIFMDSETLWKRWR